MLASPCPKSSRSGSWCSSTVMASAVLSGRGRLVLGAEDRVLEPGEVVEFDTTVPHWFGSTGEAPAEMLSIFGRPGERMRHRGADS